MKKVTKIVKKLVKWYLVLDVAIFSVSGVGKLLKSYAECNWIANDAYDNFFNSIKEDFLYWHKKDY